MSEQVFLEKVDNIHIRVHAEPSTKMEMSEYFTFYVPGYKFMPAYKNRMWDGKIRLLNTMSGLIYYGLMAHIAKFCKSRGYSLKLDDALKMNIRQYPDDYGYQLAKEFKTPFPPRDYQNKAIVTGLRENRRLFLSPTASGKSFIIYLLSRYHVEKHQRKVLIIVPTISLVTQMAGDFKDYNNGKDLNIHKIQSGADKNIEADYTISTWQSLHKLPKKFFDKFDVAFVDEAHLAKAKSITKIMEKMPDVEYRFGLTGTLDDTLTHKLVLTGLFGPVMKVIRTKELIDNNTLATFNIKAIVLQYSDQQRKEVSKLKYQDEIDWLVRNDQRNKYICNLAQNLPGNTLVLFQLVEKHGKVLEQMMKDGSKNLHFIHGGVAGEEREMVRQLAEKSSNNIILASYGTFSTGINIKKLDNIIFASPSKSKIRNLQSIGRVLRKGNGKDKATLYDVVDDLKWKSRDNFAIKHFLERMNTYSEERFEYKLYNIQLEG